MDTSVKYRIMCYKAKEVQQLWSPTEGDFMVAKASYCGENDECSEDNVCTECLEMSNIFVISGGFTFSQELGGQHWFFGGSPCVRGGGNRMNDTYCFTMTKSGHSGVVSKFDVSSQGEKIWLPMQDQLQQMFLTGLTEHYKVRYFIEWLDEDARYNPFTYSLEMLWLMFYMQRKQGKKWDATSNIQEWVEV
jgi:hypothetical protein